jgi:hypothetical protein
MNKIAKLFGIALLSGSLLVGCSMADKDVSTGTDEANAEESSDAASVPKTVKVNKTVEAMGVKLTVGEIKLKQDEIQVGVSLHNTSSDTRNILLDMDTKLIVDGETQVTPNPFMGDTLDNEMAGGIKQSAVMVFPTKDKDSLNPSKVKKLEIRFPSVSSSDFTSEKKIDPITVNVK